MKKRSKSPFLEELENDLDDLISGSLFDGDEI